MNKQAVKYSDKQGNIKRVIVCDDHMGRIIEDIVRRGGKLKSITMYEEDVGTEECFVCNPPKQ